MRLEKMYKIFLWLNILLLIIGNILLAYFGLINSNLADGILLVLAPSVPILIFNIVVYFLIIVSNWLKFKEFPTQYFFHSLMLFIFNPAVLFGLVLLFHMLYTGKAEYILPVLSGGSEI